MPSVQRAVSTLTPAEDAEMQRMDVNGDGIIDGTEARAAARSSAKLRASNSKYKHPATVDNGSSDAADPRHARLTHGGDGAE